MKDTMTHTRPLVLFFGALVCVLMCLSTSTAMAQDTEEPEAEVEGTEEGAASGGEGAAGVGSLRRSNRMEFDARLIRGETAGSGAVFLFQRAPRALPSMVPLRQSYLQQSVDNVLTPGWTPPRKKSTTSASSVDILESTVVTQGTSSSTSSDSQSSKTTSSSKKKASSKKKKAKKRKRKKGKKSK